MLAKTKALASPGDCRDCGAEAEQPTCRRQAVDQGRRQHRRRVEKCVAPNKTPGAGVEAEIVAPRGDTMDDGTAIEASIAGDGAERGVQRGGEHPCGQPPGEVPRQRGLRTPPG